MTPPTKIARFIEDVSTVNIEQAEMIRQLISLFAHTAPNATIDMKYGGIVFLINSKLKSGIFVRKQHISVEFGEGYQFDDPEQLLEGKGRFRRHLKLFDLSDIQQKNVKFFVTQSVRSR